MDSIEGNDALFIFATEAILVADSSGTIIRVNSSAEALFKYSSGELIGQKIEVLVPNRFSGHHHQHRNKYNENPHPRKMGSGIELFGLTKNGTEIPVEISLSPYVASGNKYTIAFIVDVSHRKLAEEKMRDYSSELEQQVKNRTLILEEAINELEETKKNLYASLEKERELNELKSRFVSMASHEFRTPLATIQSSLSLVRKYGEMKEIEKQDKHIAKIKTSIGDLTDILNDFLSVSKLEEGKVECLPEEMNLPHAVTEIVGEMQTIARTGQKMNYKHLGDETVILDKRLLKNILFNLMSNAIKFSPDDSEILVQSEATNNSITISLKDAGIGISEQDQKHLFERFFRGHNATHIQGTGLGLNIVAKYVEIMNGTINLTSEENKGTTFFVKFPK